MIALALFVLGASAGASADGAPADAPLVLWHSYTGQERAALEAVVAHYNQRPELRRKVRMTSVPHDAYPDKITAAIPRGHGPDVFIFAHDRIGGWVEGGQIAPIELFVDEALLDAHESACVFALAYGNSLYGLPLAAKALALYVRSDLVPEAMTASSMEILVDLARRFAERPGRFGLVYHNVDFFFHTPWLQAFGGTVFEGDPIRSPRSARPKLHTEAMVRSLAYARSLALVPSLVPDDPNQVTAAAMFARGRAPLVVSGPWFRSELEARLRFEVRPLPPVAGRPAASGFATCEAVLLSRHSAHPEDAFSFMRFLSSTPEGVGPRMAQGGQPVTWRPAWRSIFPTLPARLGRQLRAFQDAFRTAEPTPSHPLMAGVWTPMNAALYKTIHQGMAPEAAAQEAQVRVERGLR